ncbi:twin-arginine translocation signal domain-containing protein, partial [Streptomyces sp. MBT57]|nr:twin-arginine translocation signal domain-containing protein [Streptomyces sp. MBT57]
MRDINRRGLLGAGLGTAAAIGLAGCGFSTSSGSAEGGQSDDGGG